MSISDAVIDNTRHLCMEFDIDQDALLHGFSGYFETVLYGDIKLSKLRIIIFSLFDGNHHWKL
jgi:protein arginine N-methyltransferase 5